MILILTNKQDFAVDFTILRMEERGIPFLRVNSEDLGDLQFIFELDGARARRVIKGPARTLDLADVTCVWFRRQMQPSANWVADEDRSFIATEYRFFLDGFLESGRWRWVNSPHATFLAERKLHVLARAADAGLKVPRTIVTNDHTSLHALEGGAWIAKPIYQGIHSTAGELHAIYTQRVRDLGQLSDDAVRPCPCVFQEEVQRGRDLRLTFIGDAAFGSQITWDSVAQVDWRTPSSKPCFSRYEIPDKLIKACRRLMTELGLCYGAFDFVVDTDGTPWFLEVNPAGEFAWLEVELGLPMRDALLDLLAGECNG